MVLAKDNIENSLGGVDVLVPDLTASQKRRIRRKKLQLARISHDTNTAKYTKQSNFLDKFPKKIKGTQVPITRNQELKNATDDSIENNNCVTNIEMSSTDLPDKLRENVIAAREAKKLAKQKGKIKSEVVKDVVKEPTKETQKTSNEIIKENVDAVHKKVKEEITKTIEKESKAEPKGKDEVDKATKHTDAVTEVGGKNKEQIKAERSAKKAAKQAKKKGVAEGGDGPPPPPVNQMLDKELTAKDMVETLNDIVNVAKEIQEVSAKVNSIDLEPKKPEETSKSKAELKAERRAKQEAQRLAKQAATQQHTTAKPKVQAEPKPEAEAVKIKEKSPKQKVTEKPKVKSLSAQRVNWFQHLYKEHDKEVLKNIAINSNFHPAIVKLGAQLASRVVTGSNARCVALLDALKKMVRDYTLPAKTEFARGLESHLASSLEFLWSMRQPSASQTNAVKFFRHHLTQLPNNVDEFDAKKTLQEEIDRYIREQIDMAGEAISIAVRNKISTGDNILTYGCSSLIERIFREAWRAGVQFRAVVVGNRVLGAARRMARRLARLGLPCTYVDITALSIVINTAHKVVLGAGSLLVDGCVVAAAGGASVALAARDRNLPVLVACETHKFSDRVQTDAFVYNEIGDPDELIDKSDENSPLKDWRSNPNLTPLNLIYDVIPPSLVTAVVTELAILPCTSAPVVLRFKLSEYGI